MIIILNSECKYFLLTHFWLVMVPVITDDEKLVSELSLFSCLFWFRFWGPFLESSELYGLFSGVAIPFVFQERIGFKSSNFRVIFLFVTSKTCYSKRSAFQIKRLAVSQMAFRVRKMFGTFEKRAPGVKHIRPRSFVLLHEAHS